MTIGESWDGKSRPPEHAKKLRRVPFDPSEDANTMMAPQEMLDFLAMTAGIKPVFLLGRGFDDPQWVEGVAEIAHQMKLHVLHPTFLRARRLTDSWVVVLVISPPPAER